MDGPIDWRWKMNLLDVCVQAGFCQIRSHLGSYVGSMPITKRSVLKLTAKIFDPLGFVSPFVMQLNILFQLLCQGKLD